jgi:hypothetical protein
MQGIQLRKFLELVGHETIWDVIYSKYIAKENTFTLSDGTVIDLTTITISPYKLSSSKKLQTKMVIKNAKTNPRNTIDTSLDIPELGEGEDDDFEEEEEGEEE